MARTFTSTPSYAQVEAVPVTAPPYSMACWFYASDVVNGTPLVWIGNSASSSSMTGLSASGDIAGDPIRAFSYEGSYITAESTAGYTATTWQHAAGVWSATNARAAYLNGGNKGTETTSKTPGSWTRSAIAAFRDASPNYVAANTVIAEVGIWNVALTDDEVASLGDGWAPSLVRPQNLVAYVPLIGYASTEVDLVGGNAFALTGSPAAAAHPRMIYSRRHRIYVPAAAVGAVTASQSESITVTDSATQAVGILVSAAEYSGEDTLTSSNW